jgi:cation transport regulator ChaC
VFRPGDPGFYGSATLRAVQASSRWVFGYGSLVWRPAFAYRDRAPGFIRGFARRFWQGSPDHRGVPHAPGRVVTLVPDGDAVCWGVAYRVADADWHDVLRGLDRRESGGFERHELLVRFAEPGRVAARALVYVAAEGNPNFLGPAPLEQMAAQVRSARGKSGSNADYVEQLATALRALGAEDEHVFELAAALVRRARPPRLS